MRRSIWLLGAALGSGVVVGPVGHPTASHAQTPTHVPSETPHRYVAPEPDTRAPMISVAATRERLTHANKPLLLDIREDLEFRVSHLAGAERLIPTTASERAAAVASIIARARSRAVILYCTTSMRSYSLAEAIYHDLIEAGVASVEVVDGGIVAWANADLPLIDGDGRPSRRVHTGDAKTAAMLRDPTRAVLWPAR